MKLKASILYSIEFLLIGMFCLTLDFEWISFGIVYPLVLALIIKVPFSIIAKDQE